MSDTTIPPVTTPAEAPRARGYFNKAQIEDLGLAESISTATASYLVELDDQDISAAYLTDFAATIGESRARASQSGQGAADSQDATETLGESSVTLHIALQKIQSSAKQKHKMLAEDGDPATDFATGGYLIATRLNASRGVLIQSAETLITRIKADSLPGFKTPEKIAAVQDLLDAFRGDKSAQQDVSKDKELARLGRDELLHVLNTRRSSIQHAADAIWPWNDEAHRPIRKTFALPLTRPMGM